MCFKDGHYSYTINRWHKYDIIHLFNIYHHITWNNTLPCGEIAETNIHVECEG